MVRPLRLEFPGALYHLTARGNAQQDIYVDDQDRQRFLEVLAREISCVKRIEAPITSSATLAIAYKSLMAQVPHSSLSPGSLT